MANTPRPLSMVLEPAHTHVPIVLVQLPPSHAQGPGIYSAILVPSSGSPPPDISTRRAAILPASGIAASLQHLLPILCHLDCTGTESTNLRVGMPDGLLVDIGRLALVFHAHLLEQQLACERLRSTDQEAMNRLS